MPWRPSGMRGGSKYGARPTTIHGIRFASQREADRYLELFAQQRRGEIAGLELQPVFRLRAVNLETGEILHVGKYVADFRYTRTGAVVVEDVKGMKTAVYRLKKRFVEAQFGISITET